MPPKKTILIFRDFYLPGYKSGGPIRSIANLVAHLGDEYHFKIVTADRDEGDDQPFDSVEIGAWNNVGKAQVFYLDARQPFALSLHQLLRETPHDLAYFNSFFSPKYTILPLLMRRLRLTACPPAIVAPRGEFSTQALGLKSSKKQTFLNLSRRLGLYRSMLWHATNEQELADIQRVWGSDTHPLIAGIPLPRVDDLLPLPAQKKVPGELKLGFLGRISPIKGVDFAIEALQRVNRGTISLDIWGPAPDRAYLKHCQHLASCLPPNRHVTFRGPLPHPQVRQTIREYDAMFLPSKSESFGHTILESLMAGRPVLIGQRTPWRNLKQSLSGWDIPLSNSASFVRQLEALISMRTQDLCPFQQGALQLALKTIRADQTPRHYQALFEAALTGAT